MKKFKVERLAFPRNPEVVKGDYIKVEQGCLIVRAKDPVGYYPMMVKMYAAGHWVSVGARRCAARRGKRVTATVIFNFSPRSADRCFEKRSFSCQHTTPSRFRTSPMWRPS